MRLNRQRKLAPYVLFSMLAASNISLAQTREQLNLLSRIPEAGDVVASGVNNKLSSKEIGATLAIIEKNGTAKSHDWVVVGSNGYDRNIYFADDKKKITTWVFINIADEMREKLREKNPDIASVGSTKQLVEIDCKQRTYAPVAGLKYREPNAKGAPMGPIEYSDPLKGDKIPDGSWLAKVTRWCKKG